MSDYQLTAATEPCAVIRAEDGAYIPADPANRDYAEYLVWVSEGGVPDPYTPPPEPKPIPPEDDIQDVVLYDHENRLRALEGQPPLTKRQFQKKIKS